MPQLSVVMPVCNAAGTLRESVASVLGQSLSDLELICVDDGSTDESPAILRECAARDARVKVLTQGNLHAGPARNKGLEAARGEYVHFLDADDQALPFAYECVVRKMEKHGLDMLRFASVDHDVERGVTVDNAFNSLSGLRPGDFMRLVGTEAGSPLFQMAVTPWAGVYRRGLLMERGIRFNDLTCVNDRSFYAAALTSAGRTMVSRDRVVLHRVNQAGSLVGRRAANFDCHFRSIELIVARMAEDGVDLQVQERVLRAEFTDLFVWFARLCDDPEHGEAIKAGTARFVDGYRGPYAHLLRRQHREALKRTASARPPGAPPRQVVVRHEACARPKVSVVVPVRGAEDTLNEALGSLAAQTLEELEVLCAGSGATREELAIVREYAALDQRFRVVEDAAAALAGAQGDYVGVLDPRDFAAPSAYAELCRAAAQHDADLVKADFRRFATREDGGRDEQVVRLSADGSRYGCALGPLDEPAVFAMAEAPGSGICRRGLAAEVLREEAAACGEAASGDACGEAPGEAAGDAAPRDAAWTGAWFRLCCRASRVCLVDKPLYAQRRPAALRPLGDERVVRGVLEEYRRLAAWLDEDPALAERARGVLLARELSDALAALERTAPQCQREARRLLREEFAAPLAQGLLEEGAAPAPDAPVSPPAPGAAPVALADAARIRAIVAAGDAAADADAERVRVSVVMPAYNAEAWVGQALDGLLARGDAPIEVICVDDGSTDGTLAVLCAYEQRDPRVRVLVQENAGAGAARNNGMQYARGEYLSFLDADDLFEPDMLARAYARASAERLDLVVFHSDEYLQASGTRRAAPWTINASRLPDARPFAGEDIPERVFNTFVGWTWDKLFRTEFVRDLGLQFQEQRTTNDLLFTYSALLRARRVDVMEDVLVHRRIHEGSLSATRERSWGCFYQALRALRARLVEWGLYERREQDFVSYSLHFTLWHLNSLTGKAYRALYAKLKEEWLADLGVLSHGRDYFPNVGEYEQLEVLQRSTAEEFLFWQLGRAREERDELQRRLSQANGQVEGRKREVKRLGVENDRLRAEAAAQRAEVGRLRDSTTWKAGRVVTWPARKLKRLAKRLVKRSKTEE